MSQKESNKRNWFEHPVFLAGSLFALPLLLFWEAQYYLFVGIDDSLYVWNNPTVIRGLTWAGIQDVFTRPIFSLYHPLTWASLMADSSIFGRTEQSYHRTSILLHCANVTLLFLILRRATGQALPAAFAAAIFAVHPLNIESVAWVSSRKDVLGGFFWLLGCFAYCAIPVSRNYLRIATVTTLYVMSLLSKGSMIAFPFTLLLLDYWPLGRFGSPPSVHWKTLRQALLEKTPLLSVFLVFVGVSFSSATQTLKVNEVVPLTNRISDAIINYAMYIGKFFAPINLSAQYPYPVNGWSTLTIVGSAVLLAAITATAWFTRKRFPFIAVGWLWFVGVMAPLCGIIIVGSHSRADRYMYVPIIGLAIIATWGGLALINKLRLPSTLRPVAAVTILTAYTVAAWTAIPNWRDEKTLAAQMVDAQEWNPMGHYLMAKALEGEGNAQGALEHFERQLELAPRDASGHVGIGNLQLGIGAYDSAAIWFEKAMKLDPYSAQSHYGLATAKAMTGHSKEAVVHLQQCLELQPDHLAAQQLLAELETIGSLAAPP